MWSSFNDFGNALKMTYQIENASGDMSVAKFCVSHFIWENPILKIKSGELQHLLNKLYNIVVLT